MKRLRGIGASAGFAIGPAFVYRPRTLSMGCQVIDAQDVAGELARWQEALAQAQSQLAAIQARAEQSVGKDNATIFAAQALMLEDPALLEFVQSKICDEHLSAPAAMAAAADFYAGVLAALPDECWRARAADVQDVAQRVIRLLLGVEDTSLAALTRPSI
ncbi:MAG: phosphoenolpyruvate--protein phosphotransferase, partial [Chloroflexi bacterium]|nr:phosphoenolpyruvate--protein phosphotransferase [Chloroflexota bacterium]